MTLPELVEVAKTGGPYTVLVVLAWIVRYLYLSREVDRDKHENEKQALNDRIVRAIETQNAAMEEALENHRRQNDALYQAMSNQHALIQALQSRGLPSPTPPPNNGRGNP